MSDKEIIILPSEDPYAGLVIYEEESEQNYNPFELHRMSIVQQKSDKIKAILAESDPDRNFDGAFYIDFGEDGYWVNRTINVFPVHTYNSRTMWPFQPNGQPLAGTGKPSCASEDGRSPRQSFVGTDIQDWRTKETVTIGTDCGTCAFGKTVQLPNGDYKRGPCRPTPVFILYVVELARVGLPPLVQLQAGSDTLRVIMAGEYFMKGGFKTNPKKFDWYTVSGNKLDAAGIEAFLQLNKITKMPRYFADDGQGSLVPYAIQMRNHNFTRDSGGAAYAPLFSLGRDVSEVLTPHDLTFIKDARDHFQSGGSQEDSSSFGELEGGEAPKVPDMPF